MNSLTKKPSRPHSLIFVLVLLAGAAVGCGKFGANNAVNKAPATPARTPAATHTPLPKPEPESDLPKTLRGFVGKYPSEVKLLERSDMRSRLTGLLASDFADMRKSFNVETPIDLKDNVIKTSGCEAHNCGGNQYFIFVDLEKDNINVYHVKNGKTTPYFEKGKIDLPDDFSAELDTIDE